MRSLSERMLWPRLLLPDAQRLLIQGLRLLMLALLLVEVRQSLKRFSRIEMLCFQTLLSDCERSLIQQFRLLVPVLMPIEFRQSIHRIGGVRTLRPRMLLMD